MPPAPPNTPLLDRQLAVLSRIVDIGLEIAEAAGRAATTPLTPDTPALPDPGLTYARAARAVRMTVALQSRLIADQAAADRAAGFATAARATGRRARAHELVERAIEAEHADPDEVDRLSSDAWERLVDEDDADLAARSVEEIVAAICRDLGLSEPPGGWPAAHAPADHAAGLGPWPPPAEAEVIAAARGPPGPRLALSG